MITACPPARTGRLRPWIKVESFKRKVDLTSNHLLKSRETLYYAWPNMALSFFCFLLLALLPIVAAKDEQQPLLENGARPNILFILTDDQDVQMGSLDFMPRVKEHLIDKGLQFKRHYCTVALCCPSRVSLWTGKAARKSIVYLVAFFSRCNDAHGLFRKITPT